jgi:hypothetical protein
MGLGIGIEKVEAGLEDQLGRGGRVSLGKV